MGNVVVFFMVVFLQGAGTGTIPASPQVMPPIVMPPLTTVDECMAAAAPLVEAVMESDKVARLDAKCVSFDVRDFKNV